MNDHAPDENPFAAPTTGELAFATEKAAADSDYEVIRKRCIQKEASIKAVAWLCIVGGALAMIIGVMMAAGAMDMGGMDIGLVFGLVAVLLGGVQLAGALGTRKFLNWGRTLLTIALFVGVVNSVLSFSIIGLLLQIWFLTILWRSPADEIFSDFYRDEVIPATPHIKSKTAIFVWILLALAILLLLLVVGAFFFSANS